MINLYLTENMRTGWIHILYEYCDEKDTPNSDSFDLCHEWLFEYFNELQIG